MGENTKQNTASILECFDYSNRCYTNAAWAFELRMDLHSRSLEDLGTDVPNVDETLLWDSPLARRTVTYKQVKTHLFSTLAAGHFITALTHS
jgi:hypothetical protein